jgi:uncharacterized protein YktA (UPF0223 family)
MKIARREAWKKFGSIITAKTPSQQIWQKTRQISGKRKLHQIKKLKNTDRRMVSEPKIIANTLTRQFAAASSNKQYTKTFRKIKEKEKRKEIVINTINNEQYNEPLTEN